jgi:Glycosyltransferase family 87
VAAWLVLMPALGPVTYTRIDLPVAAALVWMLERAHARQWSWAGGWLGFGVAIKLIPLLLVPHVLKPAKWRPMVGLLVAAGLVGLVFLLPFVGELTPMYHSVYGYHSDRGVQAESLYAAVLLAMHHWGTYPVEIRAAFGAYDAISPVSGTLKTLSECLSWIVVAITAALTWFWVRKDDIGGLAMALLAALALTTAAGRVYSPQYLIWFIGVAAVAMTFDPRRSAPAVGVLAVVVLLSHLEFPYLFWDVLFFDKGFAIGVLLVRDFLTPVIGVLALIGLRRRARALRRPEDGAPAAEPFGSWTPGETGGEGASLPRLAGDDPSPAGVAVTPHA